MHGLRTATRRLLEAEEEQNATQTMDETLQYLSYEYNAVIDSGSISYNPATAKVSVLWAMVCFVVAELLAIYYTVAKNTIKRGMHMAA